MNAKVKMRFDSGLFTYTLMLSNRSLDELVHRMAQGNSAALSTLREQTMSTILAASYRLLRNKQDAEEVVNDVFQTAWSHASRFDATRGCAVAWLRTMVRGKSIDRLRKRATRSPLNETMSDTDSGVACESLDPQNLCSVGESADALYHALELLAPPRGRIIRLAFFQGLTHMQIARQIRMPLGTVKSHLSRGLKQLQENLSPVRKSANVGSIERLQNTRKHLAGRSLLIA